MTNIEDHKPSSNRVEELTPEEVEWIKNRLRELGYM